MKNQLYKLSAILFLIALSFQSNAQYTPAMLFSDLQNELNTRRAAYSIPGASISIILRDGSSWTGTSGNQCVGTVDLNKQWQWGSVSKATTATIIMQMRDQGLLSIDDSIGTYFDPSPYTSNIDATNNTIRDLLQHTSDIDDPWENSPAFQSLVNSNACSVLSHYSGLQYVGTSTPNPNKVHIYKPYINYALLGIIIEQISGNTLRQEYHSRIFTPLGMTNSDLIDTTFNNNVLNGIYNNGNPQCGQCFTAYMTRAGGGGIVSSAQDITKFMNYLHSDSILSPLTGTEMRTTIDAGITAPIPCGGNVFVEYGLGVLNPNLVFASGDTMKLYGHSGTGLSIGSVFHNIEEGWTVSIVGNDRANQLTNAMIFNILCLLHNNPVSFPPPVQTPVADFSFSIKNNTQVTFNDLSSNNPNQWFWDFGDGNTETVQNPVHNYSANGNYTVRLIASNSAGSDTTEQTVSITGIVGFDNALEAGIKIYPNPFKDKITFNFNNSFENPGRIEIYNLQSELVDRIAVRPGEKQIEWNSSNRKSGIYFYRIFTEDKIFNGRVIKE